MSDDPSRREAVRGLEGAFGELMGEFRRVYALAAESVSPGMLPATFKVLSVIQRAGSITASGLAERMTADKGQVSRSVSELVELGLVERAPDPVDRRVRLLSVTAEGQARLDRARRPHEERLHAVLEDWPLESIQRLTGLLHALAAGESPDG